MPRDYSSFVKFKSYPLFAYWDFERSLCGPLNYSLFILYKYVFLSPLISSDIEDLRQNEVPPGSTQPVMAPVNNPYSAAGISCSHLKRFDAVRIFCMLPGGQPSHSASLRVLISCRSGGRARRWAVYCTVSLGGSLSENLQNIWRSRVMPYSTELSQCHSECVMYGEICDAAKRSSELLNTVLMVKFGSCLETVAEWHTRTCVVMCPTVALSYWSLDVRDVWNPRKMCWKQIAAGVRRAFGLSAHGKPAARSYARQRSVIDCCSIINHWSTRPILYIHVTLDTCCFRSAPSRSVPFLSHTFAVLLSLRDIRPQSKQSAAAL